MSQSTSGAAQLAPRDLIDRLRNPFNHDWAPPSPAVQAPPRVEVRPLVSADELEAIAPDLRNSEVVAARLNAALQARNITHPAQVAAFVSQALVESGDFRRNEEDLYYTTPERVRAIFPSRFKDLASTAPYLRNPEGLSNFVYASRNGNNQYGDGYKYRGRGPIQITGRENYELIGFEDDPAALIRDPAVGYRASAAWWDLKGLDERTADWLDRRGYDAITRSVNGDAMQEADRRWRYYSAAQGVFSRRQPQRTR